MKEKRYSKIVTLQFMANKYCCEEFADHIHWEEIEGQADSPDFNYCPYCGKKLNGQT